MLEARLPTDAGPRARLARDESFVPQRDAGPAIERLEQMGHDRRLSGCAGALPRVYEFARRVDLEEFTLKHVRLSVRMARRAPPPADAHDCSRCCSFSLQVTLQPGQARLPERPVAFDPARDALQRQRVECIHALAPDARVGDQARLPKHAKMLGDGRATLAKVGGERTGIGRSGAQAIEDRAARGVGNGAEYVV